MGSFVFTHAFDFFYKWTPTSSFGIGNEDWPHETVTNGGTGLRAPGGYYNNGEGVDLLNSSSVVTRETASLQSSGSAAALPWGSAAADYLWNCLVPTQSGFANTTEITFGGFRQNKSTYTFTYNSASFLYDKGHSGIPAGNGRSTYPITSSWKAIEPYMTASDMTYFTGRFGSIGTSYPADYFPATINSPGVVGNTQEGDGGYAVPSARVESLPGYQEPSAVNTLEPFPPGTNPDMITYGNESTGSDDGRFFDLAGGIGISREAVSASLADFNQWGGSSTLLYRESASVALKQRRLFFPTIATGSGAPGTTWLGYIASQFAPLNLGSNEIFNENGAIFNVKFNLKRNVSIDMYPDVGAGSELLVYIFDVKPTIASPANRILPATSAGFYPPDNNIVRIKNTSPEMSFINPATGFLMETFNINVVEYGVNAQLVFEASGSLDDGKYFGCIIDDVQFCQVGVSTDPALLKPETVGGAVQQSAEVPVDRN